MGGTWEKLAHYEISSAGNVIDTASDTSFSGDDFAVKENLIIEYFIKRPTSGDQNIRLRFNNNSTGGKYSYRTSLNGGASSDGTGQNDVELHSGVVNNNYGIIHVTNIKAEEKLAIAEVVGQNADGAGNAPTRRESVFKWVDQTDNIKRVSINQTSTGEFESGSYVTVWGSSADIVTDEKTTITNVPANTRYEETDTRKIYRYDVQTPVVTDTFPNDDNWTVGTTTMGISGNALNYDNDHTLSTNTNAISYRAITAVSDTKWCMTFTLTIEDFNAGSNDGQNTMYVGLASVVTSPTANTDFLGLAISGNNSPKFVVIQRDNGQVADAPTPSGQQFSRTPTEETLYVKMQRNGSNFIVSLYSDSTFETLLESQTQSISGTISDLDNINMITMHGSTSGTPSNDGKIQNVKLYNALEPKSWIERGVAS